MAYLSLAYDLYTLEHNSELPERLLARLKHPEQYQGARYELFVAAALIRAGFNIVFEDETDGSTTHCEYTANCRSTGRQYSVEAKSRHREGLLGRPGDQPRWGEVRLGIVRLLREALNKVATHRRVVFLDVNMPPEQSSTFETSWFPDLVSALEKREKVPVGGQPCPSAYVVATNHPYHYVGTRKLAFERNVEHKSRRDRTSYQDIVDAAGEACLVQLASGARAIWRSNDEPPHSSDTRAYVTAHDLRLDASKRDDMLDTALFRGEGEAFEPMHRTVAEFLAGQALASAVIGGEGRAALPLSRSLAFITGQDGQPPTELRGLYAWFAAHLAQLGDTGGALRLIEIDAATVLTYGDAAAFDPVERRAILRNLGREDPYFRASEIGVTAVGGLAGEDLADEFETILRDPSDDTHRILTVFEVLAIGPPVTSLRGLLREIALNPTRPEWHRRRAVEAYLNGAEDVGIARRAIFDDLAAEPVSAAREALRIDLACALPPEMLSADDIKSVISDYQLTPDDRILMGLFRLDRSLEAHPLPELFDVPIDEWLPEDAQRHHSIEVEDFLDRALATSIRMEEALTAERLWNWTVNVRDDVLSNLGPKAIEAIGAWLDDKPGNDAALFAAVLGTDDMTEGAWVDAPVIRLNEDGKRELSMLRWGLIPFWAKDEKIGYRTINARSETVAEKPSFRDPSTF